MISLLASGRSGNIVSLTTEDGLANNSVFSIYKDSQSYIYIGTMSGVDRFDGTNIVNITFPTQKGDNSESKWVTCFLEENPATLLIGTKGGLWRLDKRSLSVERVFAETISFDVNRMVKGNSGALYLATSHGVFVLKDGRLSRLSVLGGSKDVRLDVVDMSMGRRGKGYQLWLVARHSLINYFNGKSVEYSYNEGNVGCCDKLLQVVQTHDGRLFVGTADDGLKLFVPKTGRFESYFLKGQRINSLAMEGNSLLVSTGDTGAYEIDLATNTLKHVYDKTNARFNSPVCFYRDMDGCDWLGYRFFGLDYSQYDRGVFHTFEIPAVFNSADFNLRSFNLDGRFTMLGTRNGLYAVDSKQGGVRFIGKDRLRSDLVSQIAYFHDRYYVGTIGGGCSVLDGNSLAFVEVPSIKSLGNCNVYEILCDADGNVWFCTSSGLGCYNVNTGKMRIFTTQNSQLPDNEVFCICIDSNGVGWVSTRGGLCLFDPNTGGITIQGVPAEVKSKGKMRSITRSGPNTVLFIPQQGYPLSYNQATGRFVELNVGLEDNAPEFLFYGEFKGGVIFCTEDGLYYRKGVRMRRFGYIDGLPNLEFQSHSFTVKDDRLYFATNGGLVYAGLNELCQVVNRRIPIIINEIQTDHWYSDKETNEANFDRKIKLSRYSSDLSLSFSPLIYGNTKGLKYRYKLEGYDKDWHFASHSRKIFYHSLPSGDYVLKIEAFGKSEVSAEVKISVPFTYASIVISVMALLLITFVAHVAYCRILKKEYIWDKFLPKPIIEKYRHSKMDRREGESMVNMLLKYMDEKKPYLNPELSMSDLAKGCGCTTHTLSQLFSLFLKRSYYDFVSEYRVKEFKRLAADSHYNKYTINALAEKCGFRSRTPFLTAFKKFTGKTPKDYLKEVRN